MSSFHPRSFLGGWGRATASIICPTFGPPGQVYDLPHEKARSLRRRPGAPRTGLDREVAGTDLRPHAPLRPRALDLSLLRPRRAADLVDVGRISNVAARDRPLRHPLRHALVEARQRMGGRAGALRP